ncbi:MAG: GvpL/GvpF family gas vesicle protein [Planctomycetia bacterium]|nr:GvpL/GvpF family gas vesicle protein [Planctomycetia bacterium]
MSHAWYVYCFTWAGAPRADLGEGVDPRFPVERIANPPLAAVASRVGWDRVDLSKLEEGTVDVPWLCSVAARHHEVVFRAAGESPVLPLRLGTLFRSRESLLARMRANQPQLADALEQLNGRQEWSVKIYRDREPTTDPGATHGACQPNSHASPLAAAHAVGGDVLTADSPGRRYFAEKHREHEGRRAARQVLRRELSAVESALEPLAAAWRRLGPLPACPTNEPQTVVWNGVFLLPVAWCEAFRARCRRLQQHLADQQLRLELSGPWPPYHFCPAFGV